MDFLGLLMTPVNVGAVGMVSSLGPTSVGACAAARAGISRARELTTVPPTEDEDLELEYLIGHPATGPGFVGVGRVKSLLGAAITDLLSGFESAACNPARTTLHLALSSSYFLGRAARVQGLEDFEPEISTSDAAALLPWTLNRLGLSVPLSRSTFSTTGRLGVLDGLGRAVQALREGEIDHAFVAAADSLLSPRQLEACVSADVLKGPDNPYGFQPGEGAVVLVLERPRGGWQPGVTVDWCVSRTGSQGKESASANLRDVLTRILSAGDPGSGLQTVIGDLNGELFRARAWGDALSDGTLASSLASSDLWIPALSFGESGAAVVNMGICMLVQGNRRGYTNVGPSVLWSLDPEGSAGAVALQSVRVPKR